MTAQLNTCTINNTYIKRPIKIVVYLQTPKSKISESEPFEEGIKP